MKVKIKEQIAMNFVLIPSGTFIMGSPEDEVGRFQDESQHEITISNSFYMQNTPITQAQWMAIEDNTSYFKYGGDYPVESISWEDTQIFIKKLNELTDKTFRLPTEAEWEYACRAGSKTPFNVGYSLENHANCCDTYHDERTSVVKSFSLNDWGLYDMHGNVWEWCSDWYGDYPMTAVTDPTGPATGSHRVLRGGSWGNCIDYCRSACRFSLLPDFRYRFYGFRLILDYSPTKKSCQKLR